MKFSNEIQNTVLYLTLLICFSLAGSTVGHRVKTLVTYNTALYDQIGVVNLDPSAMPPSLTERRDAIIEQLDKLCADVVCLQEVWNGESINAFIKDLATRYPYSFSALHDASGSIPNNGVDTEPACPLTLFTPVSTCIQTKCSASMDLRIISQCLVEMCLAEISALSQECWICFYTAGPDFSNILQRCTDSVPGPYRKINKPGLLLLSRRPMKSKRYTDLHPGTREIFERGYLQAEVRGIGQVVCTHTTAYDITTYIEPELMVIAGITSWVEQGEIEMNTLVEQFSKKRKLFLLGDVNVGPPALNVTAIQPEIYSILTDAFCVDPVECCTYCSSDENIYNGETDALLIDHIFYKGYRSLRKKRIFDDVTIGEGFRLSDHFGVMQKFMYKRTICH